MVGRISGIKLWAIPVVAIILAIALTGGIDFCDTGFYMTFYENMLNHPADVEYNFMYWLSGVIGGIWLKLWPEGGVLWMRILGLLCLGGSITIAVCIFKARIWNTSVFIMAMAIIAAISLAYPLTFNYDSITFLLTIAGLYLLILTYNGQSENPGSAKKIREGKRRWALIAGAGLIFGIDIFSRIPNILAIGYILLIVMACWRDKRKMWLDSLIFCCGYIVGSGLVLGIMALAGHLSIFLSNMEDLFNIAGGKDGEASHGLANLIAVQLEIYLLEAKTILKLGILAIIYYYIGKIPVSRLWRGLMKCLIIVPAGIWVIYGTDATILAASLALTGCAVLLFTEYRLTGLAGILMTLIVPLGSDYGIYNTGPVVLLVSLPASLSLPFLSSEVQIKNIVNAAVFKKPIWGFGITVIILCIVRSITGGLYFDSTPLYRLTFVQGVRGLKGTSTSEERALLIKELADGAGRYVNPGDKMLVYGSAPLLNYVTSTRPAGGCSWPEQLAPGRLNRMLETELKEGEPIVMVLKFNTIGAELGIPSQEFTKATPEHATKYHTFDKARILNLQLSNNGYIPIEDTGTYTIYKRKSE